MEDHADVRASRGRRVVQQLMESEISEPNGVEREPVPARKFRPDPVGRLVAASRPTAARSG